MEISGGGTRTGNLSNPRDESLVIDPEIERGIVEVDLRLTEIDRLRIEIDRLRRIDLPLTVVGHLLHLQGTDLPIEYPVRESCQDPIDQDQDLLDLPNDQIDHARERWLCRTLLCLRR